MSGRAAFPRLLCVPGLGLDDRAWRPTIRALGGSDHHEDDCVAPLPGFGLRPAAGVDLRPATLGAQLAAGWLTEVSIPTILMGHSASCQIVTHAARLVPGRVSALVLVGPTTDPRAVTWGRIAERWLRTAVWERPSQLPLLARTYARTGPLWMLRAMDAARRDDLRECLGAVDCPVLVARGRHDRICSDEWVHELMAAAPVGSRAVTLEKGAHMVPLTHADMLAAALRSALR